MPLIQRKGAQSSQGFGEFAQSTAATYIEDVFSTWLYTGTGTNQTITNNINLSGNGGLVWIKDRTNAYNHNLFDTAQGATKYLHSNTTGATGTDAVSLTSFNANGFSLGTGNTAGSQVNTSADNFVSWTFRKQAKFFDIVTYTGDGTTNRTISHNLGSVPGCIIVKRTDSATAGDWWVYHISTGATQYLTLNSTAAAATYALWGNTSPTSTGFTVNYSETNGSGRTYVAYLFASNAGGFGSDGTQNVITCGSYTGNGATGQTINLGWEAQWVLIKNVTNANNWAIFDNMRGMAIVGNTPRIDADVSNAEYNGTQYVYASATGFTLSSGASGTNAASNNYIYIAIRRGPMKTPTVGTSVFKPVTRAGTGTTATVTSTVSPVDMLFSTNQDRVASSVNSFWDRLRGGGVYLNSNVTNAEASNSSVSGFDVQNGVTMQGGLITNGNSYPYVNYNFQRAPSFFDEVCYTGTGGAGQILNHNLGVSPEMIIIKDRTSVSNWSVSNFNTNVAMYLDSNGASFGVATATGISLPTTTTFKVAFSAVNNTGDNFVAYLFASCPGVSKVGSYSGTGATQTINCGFTGGARFVLIKRTNSTGDWYVWDTARGMVAGTDPYLLLDSTAAEVNANNVYTTSVGFQIVGTGAGINASGGTYIFWAVS